MSTERSSAGEQDQVAANPDLMADARARIRARWQAPAVVETGSPRGRRSLGALGDQTLAQLLRPKIAMAAIAAVLLITALLTFGNFEGGKSTDASGSTQPTVAGKGYVPGVIDPPDLAPTEQPSSSTTAPTTEQTTPCTPTATNGVVKPPAPPAPPTFSAMAGPGCGGPTKFTGVGSYRDGKEGWVDHGSGCGSAFVSIPMSGDARKDDTSAFGVWTFSTGPVTTGTCAVSVYVPNGSLQEVGGNPTSYRVYDSYVPSGSPTGSFEIKQVSERGKWVGAGSFRVTSGKLAVQLLTRGQDWNSSGPTYAHHAAAMVKADCKA
jgi:hypothetical protein